MAAVPASSDIASVSSLAATKTFVPRNPPLSQSPSYPPIFYDPLLRTYYTPSSRRK